MLGGSRDTPPTVAVSDPLVLASEGQLIEVRCSASGNPLPDYFLSRIDGHPLNPSVSIYLYQTDMGYQFHNNTINIVYEINLSSSCCLRLSTI